MTTVLADEVREATEKITQRFDRRYLVACIEREERAVELYQALGESGLLGVGVPEKYGGRGGGIVELATLVEVLGRAGLPTYGMIIANFARNAVIRHGNAEQIDRFVRPTLVGSKTTSFGLTEREAGTNTFAMATSAVRDGDGWRLSGEKVYITNAAESDQMLVIARTSPYAAETRSAGLSLFMVDLPADGTSTTLMRTKVTLPERQYAIRFEDVWLPDDALVGEENQGVRCLFDALNPERVLAGMLSCAIGFHVLDRGSSYARERAPFGRPIGGYQAIAHPLAKSWINLEAARLLIYEAARACDRDEYAGPLANAAKYAATEAASAALDASIQAHGGAAFDEDNDVVGFYQLLRTLRVAPVSNEMVLNYVAERVLSLPRGY